MAYVDDFASEYSTDPSTGLSYTSYDQFKQAVIALWNASADILADDVSSDALKYVAKAVSDSPVQYGRMLMGVFLADSTVRANYSSPSDGQMLTAAEWILEILTT